MRQALGLHDTPPSRSIPDHPTPSMNGSHPQRRRFVREGEVPVTLVNRDQRPDGAPGYNQLEAARQAIRSQAAARERAERLLEEAQSTIRDLQTKLAHERLAKDEALQAAQRAATARQDVQLTLQAVQAELTAERLARRAAENAAAKAQDGCREAEQRLRDIRAAEAVQGPAEPRGNRKAAARPRVVAVAETPDSVDVDTTPKPSRRRGRPPKVVPQGLADVVPPDSDVVEWWVPGWKGRIR